MARPQKFFFKEENIVKIVSKKLLSVLLAVCLLASIALPAGILSASADPAVDPMVTTIKFGTKNENYTGTSTAYTMWAVADLKLDGLNEIAPTDTKTGFWYADYATKTMSDTLGDKYDQQEFSYSFDYYASEANIFQFTWQNASADNIKTNHDSSVRKLAEGIGHFEASQTLASGKGVSDKTYPVIKDVSTEGNNTLYIWNLKIMLNGTEVTSTIAREDFYYNRAHDNTAPAALSSFAWANPTTSSVTSTETSATQTSTETETSATQTQTTATQAPATDADVVVNKINLSKWSAATYSTSSGISFNSSSSGLFSYAEEYSKIPANVDAVISFDYYLNGGTGLNVNSSKNDRIANTLTDSYVLDEGYGSFSGTMKYDSEWCWTIVPVKSINSGNVKQPDLYIWNLTVTYGDTVKTTPTTAAVNTACALCADDSLTAEQALEITNLAAVKAAFAEDAVFMTEIDFTANPANESASKYYRARLHQTYIWTANKNYTLTFDYYLPETGTTTFLADRFNSDAQVKDAEGNVIYLQPGRNTFKATGIKITTGRNRSFDFVQLGTTKFSKLYVWNVQLVPDDGASDTTSKKTNLMVGDFWEAIKVPDSDPAEIKTVINTSRVATADLPSAPVTTATSATETTATSATETTATQAQPTAPAKPAEDMVWTIKLGHKNPNYTGTNENYFCWAIGELSLNNLYEIAPTDTIKDFWYADYVAKTKSDTLNGKYDQQEFSYSFDYYSPVENTIVMSWNNSSVENIWCNHENYRKLEEGLGHFESGGTIWKNGVIDENTKTYPILKIDPSMQIEDEYILYIWNLKIMLNGVEVTSKIPRTDLYYNRADDTAELKPLSSFDWYTPPTTATTAGATTATQAPAGTTATQAPAGNTTATQAPAAGSTTATTAAATTPTQAPDAGDKGDEFVGVYDKDNDVAVEYEDGEAFPEDAYLSVYPFAEEEMEEDYENILDKIGDFDYKAFDIAVFVGEDVVDLDGAVSMKLPVPEGFDADAVKVYMTDAYGDLFLVEAEVVDGYLVFTTDVLGVCVIVNGDLGIAAQPDADAPEADDKEETDSPETGDNVVGIVIAALALVAAAAAAIVSKKRTA